MKQKHLISIIMPAYNAEKYILEAVRSILNQTYQHLELIIINDASTDDTLSIIRSIQDERIRIINNEHNSGVSISLNKGIDAARGKYIARMDADDYAHSKRLEKQVHFMEQHQDFALCGTFAHKLGDNTTRFYHFTKDSYLKSLLLFYSCFIHPSVMLKAEVLKKMKYREDCNFCEDYDLWLRISKTYKIANLPYFLMDYRIYPESVSFTKQEEMNKIRNSLIMKELNELSLTPTPYELKIHSSVKNIYNLKNEKDKSYLKNLSFWFSKLLVANKKTRKYNKSSFAAVIFFRWILTCHFTGYKSMIFNHNIIKHQTVKSFIKTGYLFFEKTYFSLFY